jgi:hypothetical protein
MPDHQYQRSITIMEFPLVLMLAQVTAAELKLPLQAQLPG